MVQVSFDNRAIRVDDQRTFLLSGTLHYPRSTQGMWPYLMKKCADSHLNAVETYVFWNFHERIRNRFDFSGRLDLEHWCNLAADHGLYVILRLGPYICAETSYGGFPAWLREVPGIRMRTNNPPFQKEMERWIRQLRDYIDPLLAPNGGPIILVQLENEYSMIKDNYGDEGTKYLNWCGELGRSLELGVPLFMCVGASSGAIETINAFYGHEFISKQRENHPDQPALWTENWTGWYDIFGYPHHVRSPENLAYSVARFIAGGGTGVNYYPFYGGTNFNRESMYLQATSYDFDAPLNEQGFPTQKFCHIIKLNYILKQYADVLVSSNIPTPQNLGPLQNAWSYRHGDRSIAFICNDDDNGVTVSFEGQSYLLSGRSVAIIGGGEFLMNTGELSFSCARWRGVETVAAPALSFSWRSEPTPGRWSDIMKSPVQSEKPLQQLEFTRDETDYCWYSTDIFMKEEGEAKLALEGVGDFVHVFVDEKPAGSTQPPLLNHRGSPDGPGFHQSFAFSLASGMHKLDILCCSLGLIKGDWMIGDANMAEERKGLWGRVIINGKECRGPWTIQPGLMGEKDGLHEDTGFYFKWNDDWEAAKNRPLRWWSAMFDRPDGNDPLVVDLSGMQKGLAWLNGHCLGRYWLVPAFPQNTWLKKAPVAFEGLGEPTQRYYHIPFEWVKGSENRLVLFEEIGGDPSSVRICRKVWSAPCIEGVTGFQ